MKNILKVGLVITVLISLFTLIGCGTLEENPSAGVGSPLVTSTVPDLSMVNLNDYYLNPFATYPLYVSGCFGTTAAGSTIRLYADSTLTQIIKTFSVDANGNFSNIQINSEISSGVYGPMYTEIYLTVTEPGKAPSAAIRFTRTNQSGTIVISKSYAL